MVTCPKPDLWRQPGRHIYRNPGTARGRTWEAVWTGGKQGRQAAPEREAGRQAAPGKVAGASAGARRGSIGRARRQALRGATRNTAPGAGHGSAHAAATRRDWPCGRGRRPPGGSGPGGRRRRGFLPGDGARDRRTGARRGSCDQPFRLGEHPCCVDPVDPALRPGHGAQRRYRKGDTISGGLPPLSGQGLGSPSK